MYCTCPFLGMEVYEEWSLPGAFIDGNRSDEKNFGRGALWSFTIRLRRGPHRYGREGISSHRPGEDFPILILEVEVSDVEKL